MRGEGIPIPSLFLEHDFTDMKHPWYRPYLYLLPAFVMFAVFLIYPLGYSFYLSFTKYSLAHFFRIMADLVEAVQKGPSEALHEVEAVEASLSDGFRSSIFARLLMPSLTSAYLRHV